ncbi:MAG TPA: hypothetical protein VKZ82_28590, partial [Nonomuraea sp.]|nr:hypothetical protein [Nonomuraea sp.]
AGVHALMAAGVPTISLESSRSHGFCEVDMAPSTLPPTDRGAHADDLARLQADHPQWRIWRAHDARGRPDGWVATRKIDDDVEPTITADTAEQLAARLARPGRRVGRGVTPEQLDALERELERDRAREQAAMIEGLGQ